MSVEDIEERIDTEKCRESEERIGREMSENIQKIIEKIKELEGFVISIWKDGTHVIGSKGDAYHYAQDEDWYFNIPISEILPIAGTTTEPCMVGLDTLSERDIPIGFIDDLLALLESVKKEQVEREAKMCRLIGQQEKQIGELKTDKLSFSSEIARYQKMHADLLKQINVYGLVTIEALNLLPEPLRSYIHNLETNCDPAGNIQEIYNLKENQVGLAKQIADLKKALADNPTQADMDAEKFLVNMLNGTLANLTAELSAYEGRLIEKQTGIEQAIASRDALTAENKRLKASQDKMNFDIVEMTLTKQTKQIAELTAEIDKNKVVLNNLVTENKRLKAKYEPEIPPTIEELDKIMADGNPRHIRMMPDGSIRSELDEPLKVEIIGLKQRIADQQAIIVELQKAINVSWWVAQQLKILGDMLSDRLMQESGLPPLKDTWIVDEINRIKTGLEDALTALVDDDDIKIFSKKAKKGDPQTS